MRSLKPHFTRKIYLLILILLIVVVAGVAWQNSNAKHAKIAGIEAKYISLGGGYIFSIPAKYVADETIIRGVTIVYPEASAPRAGENLEQLYASGTVAVQLIAALKDNNTKAFKDYTSNTLAADLRKSLQSPSDISFVKQGNVDAVKVFALANDGRHLRIIYALNLSPQPLIIVAKDESDALKIVASTMEDLKKSNLKPGIDQAAGTAKTIIERAQKQDSSGIKREGTSEFNKSVSQDKLTTDLRSSASYLSRAITIVGGSYNGKDFILQLAFEPKTKDEPSASGVLSLSKQGQDWKLNGFQLPK